MDNKQSQVIPEEISALDLILEQRRLKEKIFNLRGAIKNHINRNPDDDYNNDLFKLVLKDN